VETCATDGEAGEPLETISGLILARRRRHN
jgi:hypothetical protein